MFAPVLAITGLQYHDLINTFTQQDVELDKLFMDVCVYNNRIMGPSHVEPSVDLACRMALAYRGVAHLTMPVDLQEKPVEKKERSKRNVPHHNSDAFAKSARLPDEASLQRAAEILNQGKIRVVVLKNNTLGQIKWEQMVFLGNLEYGCELHPIDFAKFAEACGGRGYTIENPQECGATLDQAFAHRGPVLVQAVVDQLTPPMPSKVSAEEALHFAESLVRGEPNREKIALTVLKDSVRELV